MDECDHWEYRRFGMPTHYPYKNFVHKNGSVNRGNTFKVALRSSNLKEMWIVRYADDFKIFCSKRSDADKVFIATQMWLKERLNLEISPEKSKVVNLKKKYSEFLGFKIRAHKKKSSYVVYSHMCCKAIKKEVQALKEQIWHIQHPSNHEGIAINLYNSMVIGIHQYYRLATNVNLDCAKIATQINTILRNRFGKRLKKYGELKNHDYIRKRYGNSKQLRFLSGKPLCPIGYIQTKPPMWKKRTICSYTVEGRSEIHKALNVDMAILHRLMRASANERSIEFMDNRISLYTAQHGKCAVTGKFLNYDEIHCHHKFPLYMGGKDNYSNLVILHIDVHRLVHAVTQEIVAFYLQKVKPNKALINKINKLRKMVGLEQITL